MTSTDASPLGARETAEAFFREVVWYRGLPDVIMSDRHSRFLSAFWQELHRALCNKLKMTTSYNPRADPAERANRILLKALCTVIGPHYDHWDEVLPLVEFGLNSAVSCHRAPASLLSSSPVSGPHARPPRLLRITRLLIL